MLNPTLDNSRQTSSVGPWMFFPLACPQCHGALTNNPHRCFKCGTKFQKNHNWLELYSHTQTSINPNVSSEPESFYQSVLSLILYVALWRGSVLREILFFRKILTYGHNVVDLAVGKGRLSKLALLFRGHRKSLKLLALDVSAPLLAQARRQLPRENAALVRGNLFNLPFQSHTVSLLTFFGALNTAVSGKKTLAEISRVLAVTGTARGSVLLFPEKGWRRWFFFQLLLKGWHTEIITEDIFYSWVRQAQLTVTQFEKHGDVLLFELRHPRGHQ